MFNNVTIPSCPGVTSITQDITTGLYTLNCSQPWGQTAGLIVDPSYSTQLTLMLDQSGIDWEAVGIGFSSCMALFLVGVYFGFFFNMTRKLK